MSCDGEKNSPKKCTITENSSNSKMINQTVPEKQTQLTLKNIH